MPCSGMKWFCFLRRQSLYVMRCPSMFTLCAPVQCTTQRVQCTLQVWSSHSRVGTAWLAQQGRPAPAGRPREKKTDYIPKKLHVTHLTCRTSHITCRVSFLAQRSVANFSVAQIRLLVFTPQSIPKAQLFRSTLIIIT